MKYRSWKKAFSLLLACALVFTMPCVTSVWAEDESVEYEYWDKDESAWKEKTESNCDVITADHSSLFEDWYVGVTV